ncbi:MAG: hypothetical protein CMJ78_09565 [Planctomycetaceae bacterium]|nr:hypothetical protein [Planctomycetaceae bacterium]
MTDPYPREFEIAIERDKLCRYLRWHAILCLSVVGVSFGGLLGTAARVGKHTIYTIATTTDFAYQFFIGASSGALLGMLIAVILYFCFWHRMARREAYGTRVSVEGQFLRIIKGGTFLHDRKLHFRAIVDFACFKGPLMRRLGICGIQMQTSGGNHHVMLSAAVADAMTVRDTLSKIDRIREDETPET